MLRAFGATRWMRLADTVVSLAAALLAGVVGGGLAAYLTSGFMPIGIAGRAEPDPGRQFDGLVIGLGALAVTIGIAALAVLCGWLVDRRMTAPRRAPRAALASARRQSSGTGRRRPPHAGFRERHAARRAPRSSPSRRRRRESSQWSGSAARAAASGGDAHDVRVVLDAVGVEEPRHVHAVRDDPDVARGRGGNCAALTPHRRRPDGRLRTASGRCSVS